MPRGRPKGSTNKPKNVTDQKVESATPKQGRPLGSKNKTVTEVATPNATTPAKRGRGRPAGSVSIPMPPRVNDFPEPIRGFQEVTAAFGEKKYTVYCNTVAMEILPQDIEKAVEKYHNKFNQLPKRIILGKNSEKLLPFLHAQIPDLECGITEGGTATWELQFQVP